MCARLWILLLAALFSLPTAALAEVEAPVACSHCGMDRSAFAQSRMLVVYADGNTVGTCSLNCAVVEMKQNPESRVKALMVGDYRSKNLLDARAATWVIGGKLTGVMTEVAKWAFTSRVEAERFIAEHGGTLATFDECLQLALQEH